MTHGDRALVLRRFPYGESSLVVQALTERSGRVHLLAKGAYRPKSGFFGVLDLFDTLTLSWRTSTKSELATLAAARIETRRRGITRSLATYRAALSTLELATLGAQVGRPDPGLFGEVAASLDRLASGRIQPSVERVVFDLRFLQNLGLAPALEHCAACGGPADTLSERGGRRVPFSAGAGGRLCSRCAVEARESGRRVGTLPLEVVRIADDLSTAADPKLERIRLGDAQAGRVQDFVNRFLEYHLETRPRSRRALAHR